MLNKSINTDLPILFSSIDWEGKKSLNYLLRQIIFQVMIVVVADKSMLDFDSVKIEHPKQESYGDYSTSIAMVLAGKLGVKPRDLAEKLVEELNKYIRQYQSTSSTADSLSHQDGQSKEKLAKTEPKQVGEILESASVAGPGFVNMTIRKDYLITHMLRLLRDENGFATTQNHMPIKDQPLAGKKIMVEYAHPNTHKEFHIGHLRNISLGESIIRTLEAVGAQLFRANYEGDVGLHVAKAIWGVREKIKKDKLQLSALRELSPANKAKFLGEGYALGSKMYDEEEAVKKEIIELNKAIYQDPRKVELWEETRRWSLEYFDTIYYRLSSHFDRLFFESEVEAEGRKKVIEAVEKGIFIRDKDGSIYFPGEKYGLNNCVFVTKEDYATYEGKEVALEELEFKTYPFDADIHVVANEQQNFFQIAFKAVEILFPIQKGRQYHLPYGMVNFKTGKLSSRTGQVITADWLIDQAKLKILKLLKSGYSNKEADDIAEKVAVAAVKYSMLRVNSRMDIAFDLEESISLEGDSGPYLMYTYARAKSVLRKSKIKNQKSKLDNYPQPTTHNSQLNSEELSLLRTLYRFPEVVTEAARTLSPHLLCGFLFDLAQKYNLFYNKHSILGVRGQRLEVSGHELEISSSQLSSNSQKLITNFRLALTSATSMILKQGLYLLGIETVERM